MNPGPVVLEVPDLDDGRFRLRPWRVADGPELVQAWHDPAVVAGSSPPADRSLDAATRWISGCDERRLAGVAVDLVVVDADAEADDQRVLGEVGLSRIDPARGAAMIGWWVHEAHRGKGAATAAVSLLTRWVLADSPLGTLVAEIGAENHASIRVAERAGYRRIENARNPQPLARVAPARVWYVANSTVK